MTVLMEPFIFKITSGHLLLCVFLNLFWSTSDSIETSRRHTTASSAKVTTLFTPTSTSLLTTGQPSENVRDVTVLEQNQTSITLKWDKVNNISTYFLLYDLNGSAKEERVDPSPYQTYVTHVVAGLSAGRKYHFRIITLFMGANSTGYVFSASTAPLNAKGFKSIQRNTTSITLQWEKVDKVSYTLVFGDTKEDVAATEEQEVTHIMAGLTSGTEYVFTLFTVFEMVRSSGNNLTAVTAPKNVEKVHVITQTVSSITLSWNKVGDSSTYTLQYGNHSIPIEVKSSAFNPKATLTQEVPSLAPGTKYDFTLITVFKNITSTGFMFDAVTVPSMVALVNVSERSETSATLVWETVDPNWSYLLHIDGENVTVAPNGSSNVSRSFTLQPGMEYPFTVITLFSGLASTAYKDFFVTAMNCANVTWHVTTRSIQGTVEGLFTSATASNGSSAHVSPKGQNVSFSSLYPGATYNVSLEYRRDSAHFLQCQLKLTTIPPDLTAHCEYWESGYSVFIVWDTPEGLWTAVEVNVSGQTHTAEDTEQRHITIGGFQPARTYPVSLSSLSGTVRRSKPYVFQCPTDPRGVIAGSVLAVLLFGALVGLVIFILTKRKAIIRKKKSLVERSTVSTEEIRDSSLVDFAGHFSKLSMDNNRGFTKEYEGLAIVGIQHTQNAALMPENMEKNRFTNVLPYDWSRVKLHTTNGNSDYINASYIPGYNNSREYIATQGPLPATVSDFWRMIWEQKVNAIVMVTNCTEGRLIKCEQYWPTHGDTCLHNGLTITTASEQQDANWMLRKFRVKCKNSSAERTVKHFHFTAWPDHGVPHCTDVLIQFRGLIRQHMDANGNRDQTVVHCSAGVGRTGTIIALDVLLQQLLDSKVDINAFVHDMRLRRPHMVQTESQYVFLHQCIMDCLQSQEEIDESIYQNADIIYANATGLRQCNKTAI
ncbi:receptor-type tyrosine-protein phosphatase H-like isoform X1 [Phyllopteryx taeniolatus]|uniref:receptor-type tyrosine-protein phosphatase H-like isoform X1 n=1 Tax=Phyllopteryx taeniolatus TaxID=161469 RepID=UPI002AD3F702|nr:receptor-type tyrosine-protein phosphatase H-like isoform X1 [Phyllopteryx taeniolatus]